MGAPPHQGPPMHMGPPDMRGPHDMRGPPMGEPRGMMGEPRGPMMDQRGPPMEARGNTGHHGGLFIKGHLRFVITSGLCASEM